MKKIIDMLKGNPKVSDWKIIESETDSYEMFFVLDKLETVRKADTVRTDVEIYVDHDGKRGRSSISVSPAVTDEELETLVEGAIEKASLLGDPPYSIPENEKGEFVVESNLNGREKCDIAAEIANIVRDVKVSENCAVNALEIFVTDRETHIVNSRGIDKTQRRSSAMIEAIPTYNGEKESVELYEAINVAELDADALRKEIRARLEDVMARDFAKKPETKLDCPVILNAGEIVSLFGTIVGKMDMAGEYMHSTPYEIGDKLQSDPKGDKLDITLTGVIKGSPNSSYFDADGSSLVPVKVVENGVIKAFSGSSRFAQYLGKKPTGALPCIKVEPGTTKISEMTAKPYLECVYLSGIQVEVENDYIGGEIRLAYYFDGEKKLPVTGIFMSGKLSDVLNTVVLSEETVVYERYFGPRKLLVSGMDII